MVKIGKTCTAVMFWGLFVFLSVPAGAAVNIEGQVQVGGGALANSTVTLWAASAAEPRQLAQTQTGSDGHFVLGSQEALSNDNVLYLVAKGGVATINKSSGENSAIALLSVLGNTPSPKVVINEMTTVASAFTAARFVKGEGISGNPLGLRIAAGNTPNLVDLETGGWGKVIVDAGNSTWTTTLANFDTLASLITAFATVANDDWRIRFFKASTAAGGATPKNTLEAMAGIARTPWANPTALYTLFDEAYPQPKDGSRRAAPFAPYLAYTPTDFTLSLWFGGGGSYSNGNMVFDAEGNMWCGVNWLPGSQSGVSKSIGGGLIKFSPNGTALSPPITGFTGMGVDGIGWGTAVAAIPGRMLGRSGDWAGDRGSAVARKLKGGFVDRPKPSNLLQRHTISGRGSQVQHKYR
jgi:hypothetical protein